MATGGRGGEGDSGRLTRKQIVRLAAAISADKMESIAEGYMDISDETIKNIRRDASNSEAFNRDVIRYWSHKNPENQVERLAALLYQAAEECGYPDPHKVRRILEETRQETPAPHQRDGWTKINFSAITSNIFVTHDELLTMANDLRPHTAQSMKIEPAPWIRDYLVDMEELYTELTLEKINKILFREERRKLENYKVLLEPGMFEYLDIRYYIPSLRPKIKILFKGDPGMGKTSLGKKIAWDWAKETFVKVSIVFFVHLKLVKPGDSIENAIIQQTYPLEERGYTKEKISKIIQYLGQDCLLILDGLDECAHGQNDEVLKIVRGSKFMNCKILLTSRPHSIRGIERYFDTIVSVEGFTRSEAKKFARRILWDEMKVAQVLNFNPAGERSARPVINVPILLSFLCLLVREDPDIDLSDKTVSMGEIYFRMVQCLYKKFTIRKGIEFELSSLVDVLMSLGRLALQTLLSGNSLLQRSKIIDEVGEDVFEYGLLIGEDGFSLTRDMTVDILVTFPHRSLQEFLGAFFFIMNLGRKQTVHHVDKAVEEYLKNPLFSEFCLWFLDESNKFFSFPECSDASNLLCRLVVEKIDDATVNFLKVEKKFPLFSLALGDFPPEFALKAFEGALINCSKIKHLVIYPHHPKKMILNYIHPDTFQRLNSIEMGEFVERNVELIPRKSPLQFICEQHDCSVDLTVKCHLGEESFEALNTVLKFCACRNRSVYLRVAGDTKLLHNFPSVRTLGVDYYCRYKPPMNLIYPQLVNLFLIDCGLDSSYLSDLAEAGAQGRLPKLSSLDISNNYHVSGSLSVLLGSTFQSLHTLILSGCRLQRSDVASLAQARREARLPKLRHLDLSFNFDPFVSISLFPLLLEMRNASLNVLVLRRCQLNSNDLEQLQGQAVKNNRFLSDLTTLDMSENLIPGGLSVFMSHYYPHLQIFVLRECELKSKDLISLAQASNEGRLPELRHLDISQNCIGWRSKGIFKLFGTLKVFPTLMNLILCGCMLYQQDLCCLVQARLDGKLPRIRHLDISLNGLSDHVGILSRDPITHREISWENVVCYQEKRKKERKKVSLPKYLCHDSHLDYI